MQPTSTPLSNQTGSVAVVVALIMTLLLSVMAFTMDTGYLYLKQDQYQNAVEAVALSGAMNLCEQNPEAIIRKIAAENQVPSDTESLTVKIGFYDIYGQYGDFGEVADFVDRRDGSFPGGEYVNAVMITLSVDKKPLTGGLLSGDEVSIRAAAVAYRQGYGLMSYGDEQKNAINMEGWPDGFPRLTRLGRVHSDGNIFCEVTPVVGEDVYPTAAGTITNLPLGIDDWEDPVDTRPIDWDRLRMESEDSGRVIHVGDFPARDPAIPITDNFIVDEDGNHYYPKGTSTGQYRFVAHDGNHNGMVYYFPSDGAEDTDAINLGVALNHNAYNFTVASELPLFYLASGSAFIGGSLGGEDEHMVRIYCRKNIGGDINNFLDIPHSGVLYRTEKDFTAPFSSWSAAGLSDQTFFMRVIAGGRITLMGSRYGTPFTPPIAFNGSFAPPCGPAEVKLGSVSK